MAFDQSTSREYGRAAEPASHACLCRDRRLIQPTTVGLPAMRTDPRPRAVLAGARFRRQPAEHDCVAGDRGYDAEAIRSGLRARRILPLLAMRRTTHGSGLGTWR